MDVFPVDPTDIVAIVMGSLVVLIPVAGLTARFALMPIVEAVTRLRGGTAAPEEIRLLRQQMAHLEEQMQGVEEVVRRLGEEQEFRREIEAPHR